MFSLISDEYDINTSVHLKVASEFMLNKKADTDEWIDKYNEFVDLYSKELEGTDYTQKLIRVDLSS